MVGHFVRLKARILRNRLRGDTAWGVVMFVLVWFAAVLGGLSLGGLLASIGHTASAPEAIPIVFVVVFVGWVVGPVVLASVEQTLVTEHFELLPVRPFQMATGMVAAALLGPAAVATFLVFSIGAVGGYATGPGSAVVLLAVAVIGTLQCIVVARVVTTSLSNLLQGNSARQVISMVIMAVVFLPGVAGALFANTMANNGTGALVVPSWVAWGYLLPPAGLGRAAVVIAEGRGWWEALGSVAYGLAWLTLLAWVWGRGLLRSQIEAPRSGRKVRTRSIQPRFLPLPAGPVGAVAAKELAVMRRDPRVRMQLGGALMALVIMFLITLVEPGELFSLYLPFAAILGGFVVGTSFDFNLFGLDGGSFWAYAVGSSEPRNLLAGKHLAWGLLAGFTALVAALAGSLVGGSFAFFGPAVLTAWALVLVWGAVGSFASIWGAFALPEDSLYTNRHMSGRVAILALLSLVIAGLVSTPPVALVAVAIWNAGVVGGWLAGLGALGYGVAAMAVGIRLGSDLLAEHMPRLVATLDLEV